MVQSQLNPQVSYTETKRVDPQDAAMETDIFQTEIHGVDILIAVGKAQNHYEQYNVLYFPIYLLKHNGKVVQIGVYEIPVDKSVEWVNSLNSLDLEAANQQIRPLVYQFATESYLLKSRKEPDVPLRRVAEENAAATKLPLLANSEYQSMEYVPVYEIPKERSDIFTMINGTASTPLLREESLDRANQLRDAYVPNANNSWIQELMHNQHYFVVESEKDGNCLFNAVRDAFMSINQTTTIQKLRDKLAAQANERTFRFYKDQYDLFYNKFLDEAERGKQIFAEHQLVKERFHHTLDRAEQRTLFEQGKKLKEEFDASNHTKAVLSKLLRDLKIMKNVDNMDKFRSALRSCHFWADPWALSTMERVLNIKFVVLDSTQLAKGDHNNVLVCGSPDALLENKGVFTPEFYLLVEHTASNQYKLIGYKQKLIFRYSELPYDLKQMILHKCLERAGGTFGLIPDFQKLKRDHLSASNHSLKRSSGDMDEPVDITYEELSEAGLRGLYDDNIVFMFYSKSNGDPLPGKGAGEKVPTDQVLDFAPLAAIPDWRKKLSNFWLQPFTLDNHQWASVEHYYQASKFKKSHPEFYLSFSLDSGTELSKHPAMARAAGGKKGMFQGTLLRPKEVRMDADFAQRKGDEMYNAQLAKFSQNPELKQMLLSTGKAKLMHYRRGKEPEEFDKLMIIRDKLRHMR